MVDEFTPDLLGGDKDALVVGELTLPHSQNAIWNYVEKETDDDFKTILKTKNLTIEDWKNGNIISLDSKKTYIVAIVCYFKPYSSQNYTSQMEQLHDLLNPHLETRNAWIFGRTYEILYKNMYFTTIIIGPQRKSF